ncbi:heme-binding protein 2-like [Vitis riparia]|uniref:heme-binding protein 2-like n=1 Tax=Vitis riparia TaxID=96939 RepID=UPI00155A6E06|nr:heme-binding protein 2-like [Vitis riparia]
MVKVLLVLIAYLSFLVVSGHAIDSPQYTVVHSQSDFQIRLYRQSSWMSATVHGTSFNKSTKDAFHRLYKYIHGANLNSSQFAITAPVLTSVTPSALGSEYTVRFFLSPKYEESPPQPYPELNLQFDKWRSHCVAVRVFPGFAKDDTISKEIKALETSLDDYLFGKSAVLEEKNSYTIAQYNASYHPTGRVNEVWLNISGLTAEGCPSYGGKY